MKIHQNPDPAGFNKLKSGLRISGTALVSKSFNLRIHPVIRCPKFSDVWPIENVSEILKERVSRHKCETLRQLKFGIT